VPNDRAAHQSNPLVGSGSVLPTCSTFHVEEWPSQIGSSSDAAARVVEVDPQADPRWAAFVASHPHGLIYHHPLWLQVIERVYGYKPISLACETADGRILGILPLFRTHGLLTGRRLSSLPHTPTAGPLTLGDQAAAALIGAAIERVGMMQGMRLQLKSPQIGLERLIGGLVSVPWDPTYILELPAHADTLRFGDSRNHAQIKRAVNKAAREGIQIRRAETEADLRVWYQLYLETVRWHATPPRPYQFFKVVWEVLRPQGLMRLLLAEQCEAGQRKLLAGSLFLLFGNTVFYAFNGRHREDLLLRPNDAIHWQAIHDACQDGFSYYDLGEVSDDNIGLIRYKRKWGAEPHRLYRYYYPAPRDIGIGILEEGSYTHQVASAIWRRLPLAATSLLGTWIYRLL
jgi:hypothetical protein